MAPFRHLQRQYPCWKNAGPTQIDGQYLVFAAYFVVLPSTATGVPEIAVLVAKYLSNKEAKK